jgi:GNAT superfamily N-acetyltransferase
MAISELRLTAKSSLTPSELYDVGLLVREARWNQVEADWRIFLEHGHVYAACSADDRIVATTATLPYGGRFAWISMVLVAESFRRRGLATLLMRRAIDDLAAADLVPVLDATPDGRAVYGALGFQESWSYHRYTRGEWKDDAQPPPPPEGITVRPITDEDWPALTAYDALAFGAERAAVLAGLRGRLPAAELIAERDGSLVGFLLGRHGRVAEQLGPLIAEDDAVACALLARAIDAHDGPLLVDLADAKTQARAFLAARGFGAIRPLTRMLLGTSTPFDDGERTYAVIGPEFG